MTKSFPYPSLSINIRRKNDAVEWNVPTIGSLCSRNGFSHSGLSPSFVAILSRISRAALLVNVTQKMDRGSIHFPWIIDTTRSVMVCVFPDHAQALMRSGHSIVSTASCCLGLSCDMVLIFASVYKKDKKKRTKKWILYDSLPYRISSDFFLLFHFFHIYLRELFYIFSNCGSRQIIRFAIASQTSRKTCNWRCCSQIEYWFFYKRIMSWCRRTD